VAAAAVACHQHMAAKRVTTMAKGGENSNSGDNKQTARHDSNVKNNNNITKTS
jgi:hypothetical protein